MRECVNASMRQCVNAQACVRVCVYVYLCSTAITALYMHAFCSNYVEKKGARTRVCMFVGALHLAVSRRAWGTPDSEIVMVDGMFLDDSFEQDRLWDDSGTTISGI